MAKRLPQINWRPAEQTTTGNPTWESRDGMLRLVHSTNCYGVALAPRWVLYHFKAGHWRKVTESKRGGRDSVEKRAREIAAEYDAADDSND